MINIALTQQQIDELKIYYNNELDKVLKRVNEIQEIIGQFENKQELITEAVKANEEILQPKIEQTNSKEQKQQTTINTEKQPTLSSRIIGLLQKKNEPLSLKEIFRSLKIELKISKENEKKLINNIEQNIHKLRSVDNKIESIKKEGVKERLYGLIGWNNKLSEKIEKKENSKEVISLKTKQIEIKKTRTRQEKDSATPEFINWSDFIIELLNKEKKLFQLKDFLQATLEHYKLSEDKSDEMRGRLSPALTRLVEKTKVLKAITKENIKGRLYGLTEWFEKNGELKVSFSKDQKEENKKDINNEENSSKIEGIKKAKRGKSLWPEFIIETIKNQNTIIQAKTIVDIAMSKFKIPVEKYSEMRVLLASNISNLESIKDKIKSIKINGERGSYYGLKEWFYENGKIKSEYAKV